MAMRVWRLTKADLFENEDLRSLIEAAGARQPADIVDMVRTARGRANRNTIVHLKSGARFVLRQYESDFVPVRSSESIAYEHAVLGRLAGARLLVPRPFALGPGGRTLTTVRGKLDACVVAAFPYFDGVHPTLGTKESTERAAEALAAVHNAGETVRDLEQRPGFARHTSLDWVAPGRLAQDWFHAISAMKYRGRPLPGQELVGVLTKTMESLQAVGFDQHPLGLIHGDINVDNLLEKGGELQAILDFDHCQIEAVIIDLAFAAWQMCRQPPAFEAFDSAALTLLLRAYLRRHPLPADRFDALIPCMRVWWLRYMLWTARQALLDPKRVAPRRRLAASVGPSRLGLLANETRNIQQAITTALSG